VQGQGPAIFVLVVGKSLFSEVALMSFQVFMAMNFDAEGRLF
jgi:hypothetical protein